MQSWLVACSLVLTLVGGSAWSAPGPDVTVHVIGGSGVGTQNHGVSNGIRGYSFGTTSCNIGSVPLLWCNTTTGCTAGASNTDHPVIGQNMYRLKNGRFEQIGASWLKHGFTSLNNSDSVCSSEAGVGSCQNPGTGKLLGVGCTDPYSASLNGSRPLGPKSQVDVTTGEFPFPHGGSSGSQAEVWNQRVAVAQSDLDVATNAGARYFIEGHYVAPDDASTGNGLNNASYAEVTLSPSTYSLTVGATVRKQAAIFAWRAADPTVEMFDLDVPGSNPVQRFHVARKVTETAPGSWHYEYAIHNMNAQRAADQFEVRFNSAVTISNAGFRDVDAHSGEPYDTANWPAVTSANAVSWATPAFVSAPQNANALRWGTMYSFWFDADRGPTEIGAHSLSLFESGSPADATFWTNAELPAFQDGFEN